MNKRTISLLIAIVVPFVLQAQISLELQNYFFQEFNPGKIDEIDLPVKQRLLYHTTSSETLSYSTGEYVFSRNDSAIYKYGGARGTTPLDNQFDSVYLYNPDELHTNTAAIYNSQNKLTYWIETIMPGTYFTAYYRSYFEDNIQLKTDSQSMNIAFGSINYMKKYDANNNLVYDYLKQVIPDYLEEYNFSSTYYHTYDGSNRKIYTILHIRPNVPSPTY